MVAADPQVGQGVESLVAAARAAPGGGGFTAIYQRYGNPIHDYCLAVLRHREDAADAVQDTFLIAYQRLDQLRDPAKLTPWLYAIARSRCLRRIADRRRQRPVDDLEPLTPPEAAPPGEVERAERQRLVWQAASGLAPADRAVLDLYLRQGLSGAELADALGVPPAKANLMLHRMKQRMGRAIGALLVARTRRGECADLDAIASGELTPLIRKRLARHIDRCRVCLDRRDRLAPELVYASVPLAAAPLAVSERVTELTSAGATTGSDGMRWGADGFPRPGGAGAPVPVPRRLAVGAGVAGMVALGLLGGYVGGRTFAGGAPPAVEAGAAALASPSSGGAPRSAAPTGAPAPAVVVPPAAGTPGPSAPPTASPPAPTPPPSTPADLTAPMMSPLRLGDCGGTLTGEIAVTDAIDPDPTANLMLSWDAGPGSPVPMLAVGGGTYRATVQREGAARGFVTFTVSGAVADASGNLAFRAASADCTPIVD